MNMLASIFDKSDCFILLTSNSIYQCSIYLTSFLRDSRQYIVWLWINGTEIEIEFFRFLSPRSEERRVGKEC